MTTVDPLMAELAAVVGAGQVLVEPALRLSYETDWTGRRYGACRAVVRPADAREVAGVLRACALREAAVVVQGGNTGLVGGGVPAGGEVVLSTARMRATQPLDVDAATVVTGAGTPLAKVQQVVRARGLDVGVDLAARDSATIGGLTATDAGGTRVLRHGTMRAQVAGLEAVLADGSVVDRLTVPVKAGSGYDLVGLLTGSEGTLAVLTQVRLRLLPLLSVRCAALLALDDVGDAVSVVGRLRSEVPSLTSAELLTAPGLALARDLLGLPAPFRDPHQAYVLVEAAVADGEPSPQQQLLAVLGASTEVRDAVVADDVGDRRALWRYREEQTAALSAAGRPVKLDVAVPLQRVAAFVSDLPVLVADAAAGARPVVFGHLAEGNLHVNVLGVDADDDAAVAAVTEAVLRRVVAEGGSISSEHGVGRAKAGWLPLSRTPDEIRLMSGIKQVFDPAGLLGPGVLLADTTRRRVVPS